MKKQNSNLQINWQIYSFPVNDDHLSILSIRQALSQFWANIMVQSDMEVYIQFKIEDDLGIYRSVSYLQSIKIEDYDSLLSIFIEFWSLKSENYKLFNIKNIVFTYKIININSNSINKNKNMIDIFNKYKEKYELKNYKFKGLNLPLTMDFTTWGKVHFYNNSKRAIVYKNYSKVEYHIRIFNKFTLVEYKINNKTLFQFKDILMDNYNLNTFKRIIKNQTFYIEDGEIILNTLRRKTKYIPNLKPSISFNEKIITMDLETRIVNNIIKPYCLCIYDGNSYSNFFINDFKDEHEMLSEGIKSVMKRKYNNYRVYFHNFSKFDGVFLINSLIHLSDNVKPIIKDGKIIEIKFYFANYYLIFRDSLLLLPSSLKKLALSFEVETKDIFPIHFLDNGKNSIYYKGKVPDIKYFNKKITIKEYQEYCDLFLNKEWNFKDESIKYCQKDVLVLYQIIMKFSIFIHNNTRVDISKYPTLSALALAIFRCKFLKNLKVKIPILTGSVYNDIKKAYTGGSVDVFKPYGEKLYYYDVNSLYPHIMANYFMPVGNPTYFSGDILKYNKNINNLPFGIFNVEVLTPDNLNIPFLQKRFKLIDNTIKTISPLGKWTGTYTSDEIYEAIKLGYKFKIINGYTFKKAILFKEYVKYFYNIKKNSSKDSSSYIISKLLLNSLYGRFGMNPEPESHIIIDKLEISKYLENNIVTNVIPLKNNKDLISIKNLNKDDDYLIDLNISIATAAFVTANARIFMFKFKNLKNNDVYYTDTDSVVLAKPLKDKFVGSELGEMKLEFFIEKGIFLAPKVYGIISNENEIMKIKGLKLNNIKFEELKFLLIKDNTIKVEQNKWYKNLSQGNISIKKEDYTLNLTYGKRILLFNDKNLFIDTKPIVINQDVAINS